jgi:hypothetical protein
VNGNYSNALANLGRIVEESKDAIAWLITDTLKAGVPIGELPGEAAKQVLPDEERSRIWRKINRWIDESYCASTKSPSKIELGNFVSLVLQLRLTDPAATYLRPIRSAVDPKWMSDE